MTTSTALVTGFEPYGGLADNPSAQIAAALDGQRIGGLRVRGHVLPVKLRPLAARLEELVETTAPAMIVSLGLWPGETAVRLERVALNLADFDGPDNDGASVRDQPIEDGGALALGATLPLRAIEARLLGAGIPARLSNSAGTYLCNACLYRSLTLAARRSPAPPCGFIHIPLLPQQVAQALGERRTAHRRERDKASMSLETSRRAVEIAIETTAAALGTDEPDADPETA